MKKSIFLLIFFFIITSLQAQEVCDNVRPVNTNDPNASDLIPNLDPEKSQKIMACSGNAANDNFANAQSLTVNGGVVAGTTCGTLQSGESIGCNSSANLSVWYKFTATSTTHFVQIAHTGGSCFFGSAVYSTSSLPTGTCGAGYPISCQSSSGGPLTHLYQLTGLTVGVTYYIQVVYPSGGACGANATFNIQVTTASPGGTVTNKPPVSTCQGAQASCYFPSPPTVSQVTTNCTSYPLSAWGYSANSVMSITQQFTNSLTVSNISFQAIITSNCASGNVVWLNWQLFDCSCNRIACGNISSLTVAGLACGACYRLMYQFELANCSSFTTIYPYQNIPATPIPCTILPLHLLYFTAYPNQDENNVTIEWESLMEKNVRDYKLYRSDDGINFNQLATIKAIGKENEQQKYNYKDECCKGQNTRYYKLVSTDIDGTESFNKIIAVTFKDNKELVKFAPNPAEDNFVVVFGDEAKNQNTLLQIYNAMGTLVKEENFVSDQLYKQVEISDLPTGIYFINVATPASSEVIKYKLVKQ